MPLASLPHVYGVGWNTSLCLPVPLLQSLGCHDLILQILQVRGSICLHVVHRGEPRMLDTLLPQLVRDLLLVLVLIPALVPAAVLNPAAAVVPHP